MSEILHPTAKLRQRAFDLAKTHKPRYAAKELGLTLPDFKRFYAEDFDAGLAHCEQQLRAKLFAQGLAGNVHAISKYFDLVEPIEQPVRSPTGIDLSRLTHEELLLYGQLAAKAQGIDPDSILIERT